MGVAVIVIVKTFARQAPDQAKKIFRGDDVFDFVGTHAGGIASADDAPHGSSDNVVDGNVILLQCLNDTHVCQTLGSASAKYKCHLLRLERKRLQYARKNKQRPHSEYR